MATLQRLLQLQSMHAQRLNIKMHIPIRGTMQCLKADLSGFETACVSRKQLLSRRAASEAASAAGDSTALPAIIVPIGELCEHSSCLMLSDASQSESGTRRQIFSPSIHRLHSARCITSAR